MTPYEFISKWRASALKERSASQEHFIDLCRLLGEPTPAEADPTGETSSCAVLPLSSVGEMTLRLYGALSYSQNSARDLRCALNGA